MSIRRSLADAKRARKAAKRKAEAVTWGPRDDLRAPALAQMLAELFKAGAERKAT